MSVRPGDPSVGHESPPQSWAPPRTPPPGEAALFPVGAALGFLRRLREGVESGTDPVSAVVVNLTAVGPAANGYLSLYPCSAPERPTVSNLNVAAGVTVANRAVVSTAGAGTICLYTSVDTDVIVDVEAWLS